MTWRNPAAPATREARLRMDLDIAIDTLKWCHRCRYRRAAEWLQSCIEAIRRVLSSENH